MNETYEDRFNRAVTNDQITEMMGFINHLVERLVTEIVLGKKFDALVPAGFGAALGQIEAECKAYCARHPYLLVIHERAPVVLTANAYSAFCANAANIVNETVGFKTSMLVAELSSCSIDDAARLQRENDQLRSLLKQMGAQI